MKKNIALLVSIILVAQGCTYFNNEAQEPTAHTEPRAPLADIATDETTEQKEAIDSDGDGLFDYEEEEYGTDKTKVDTDGDGYDDYTEVTNGYDPLQSYIGSTPHQKLVYVLGNGLYVADVTGAKKKIVSLWPDGSREWKYYIHQPVGSSYILVQLYGPEYTYEEIRAKYGDEKIERYQSAGATDNDIPEWKALHQPSQVYLIDAADDFSITEIPLVKNIPERIAVWYFVAPDGSYVYSAETYSSSPFTEKGYPSMRFDTNVDFHMYDREKKAWKSVPTELDNLRCGRILVQDPWDREAQWHAMHDFSIDSEIVVGGEDRKTVERCFFEDRENEKIITFDQLCDGKQLSRLAPSAYDSTMLIFNCSAGGLNFSGTLGVYDMEEKQKQIIASYTEDNEQLTWGENQSNAYLLSPDNNKIVYNYIRQEEIEEDGLTMIGTAEQKTFLHFLDPDERREIDFFSTHLPYDPRSEYIHFTKTTTINVAASDFTECSQDTKMCKVKKQTLQVYHIPTQEVRTIEEVQHLADATYPHAGLIHFIGWID